MWYLEAVIANANNIRITLIANITTTAWHPKYPIQALVVYIYRSWCATVVFQDPYHRSRESDIIQRYVTSSPIGWDGSHLTWGDRKTMDQVPSWPLPSSGGNTKIGRFIEEISHVISRTDVCWKWTHKLSTPCCNCFISGEFIVNYLWIDVIYLAIHIGAVIGLSHPRWGDHMMNSVPVTTSLIDLWSMDQAGTTTRPAQLRLSDPVILVLALAPMKEK